MVMQSQEAELLTCQSVNVCSFYGGIKSKSANFRYSLKPQVRWFDGCGFFLYGESTGKMLLLLGFGRMHDLIYLMNNFKKGK